jgi:hypothetical protein
MTGLLLCGCTTEPPGEAAEETNEGTIALVPVFHYSKSPAVYPMNATITTNSVIVEGSGTITSYAVSPDLKSQTGLTFSTTTGAIFGKPTKAHDATNYTVTATGPGGKGTAVVNIRISPDNATLLAAHTWKMTKATVSPGVKIGNTTYTNLFSILDGCAGDNTIKFSSTGTVTDRTGSASCTGTVPKTTTSSWSLNTSQTILKVTASGKTANFNIETLTETMLKLSTTSIDYGDGKSHTTTYTFED